MANRRPSYFWWFLALILASCFSILCWSLCSAIFNQPEIPKNYEILKKIGRLPVLKPYTSETAPKHPTSTAPIMRKRYIEFTDKELNTVNRSLMHSYLTNYREFTFCTYLEGEYRVTATRKLTRDDVISTGFAIRLRAYVQPDEYSESTPYPVIVEVIFPTPHPDAYKGFHRGDVIELGITPHFASLLHVGKIEQKEDDTIVILTTVSLAGKLKTPHAGTFNLAPPKEVNLDARFPLFNQK